MLSCLSSFFGPMPGQVSVPKRNRKTVPVFLNDLKHQQRRERIYYHLITLEANALKRAPVSGGT